MSVSISPVLNGQVFNANGSPLVGGKIFTYLAGSSTPATTYTESAGLVAQANPIILNTRGEADNLIWITDDVGYKFVLMDSSNNTIRTIDNVSNSSPATVSQNEWVDFNSSVTYINTTQFSVAGDQTGLFSQGTRLKLVVSAGTIYGYVARSAFSTVTTITVGLDSGVLDSGLSSVSTPLAKQSVKLPLSSKNLFINPEFYVNNGNAGTAYVSGAALASGQYGHEMWKAGASGGDYTFTSSTVTPNTITIAPGKSIIQNIETSNVLTNSYILSWTGTAQARVGINSTTPSGVYATSPIVITGQTAGQPLSVEFNNGTLSMPTLNEGSVIQANARRSYQDVLKETQRYALKIDSDYYTQLYAEGITSTAETIFITASMSYPVSMRATPSVTNSAVFTTLRTGLTNIAVSQTGLYAYFANSSGVNGLRAYAVISTGFIFLTARI